MTVYVVIKRPADKYKVCEKVLGVFSTAVEANLLVVKIHEEIDGYQAAYDRYYASCKFLVEQWIRQSGLAYKTFSVREIADGGDDLRHEVYAINGYNKATTSGRYLYVNEAIRDIADYRKKYRISTPLPDWPTEPKPSAHFGYKHDYTILKIEVEA